MVGCNKCVCLQIITESLCILSESAKVPYFVEWLTANMHDKANDNEDMQGISSQIKILPALNNKANALITCISVKYDT